MDSEVRNLWYDIVTILNAHNKTWKDIEVIGNFQYNFSKKQFEKIAHSTYFQLNRELPRILVSLYLVGHKFNIKFEKNKFIYSEVI